MDALSMHLHDEFVLSRLGLTLTAGP